jgi:hypothetical protein
VCEGDEGTVDGDEWVNCDFCDGGGGFAEITPEQRDHLLNEAKS